MRRSFTVQVAVEPDLDRSGVTNVRTSASVATRTGAADLPRARRFMGPDPWTIAGIVAFFALLFVALFGERIAPYEQIYFVVEHGGDPRPYDPGIVFPFGSDVLGRDLFSVVLAGARATLTIVLLAGLGRVLAGVLVAALASWWRPTSVLTETIAQLVSAVPATLVALLLMKAFVKTDTSILVFIGALLVTGWAGPYRVIRAEVDRLARTPFTQGAVALGVGRWRLFWRHHLPHLVPVIGMNLSQQVVASLVLVAELGVLGVLVGAVRLINVAESQTAIRNGPPMAAAIPDAPEWGAMLASSRTIEALWTTRWLIFVPGIGFALTAIAVAAIGFAVARRYARRDFLQDGRGAAALTVAAVALVVAASLVPERYADAREWAAAARSEVRATGDIASALEDAGLRTYSAVRQDVDIVRSGPATVTIGDTSVAELYPRPGSPSVGTIQVQSLARAGTGGDVVEAPLVFAGRGLVPIAAPATPYAPNTRFAGGSGRLLGPLIKDYPDDYAGIDVRGKVVLLARFMGVTAANFNYVTGPSVEDPIMSALDRGAAAVLFVDPELSSYSDDGRPSPGTRRSANPYLDMEKKFPASGISGKPVIVLDRAAAERLVAPLGLDLAPLLEWDPPGKKWERSAARDLGVSARVEVSLREEATTFTSLVAEVPGVPEDAGRVVVWAARDSETNAIESSRADALAALARFAATRHAPFVFVDFDPDADSRAVRDALRERRVVLVLVLDDLRGSALRFRTANGDLIPAFDLYAQKASARYEITRRTAESGEIAAPFPDARTVVIANDGSPGDVRADAVAVIGYLAGRLALGAPELPQ
jgi:peptide/nickel transport system permease protein